MQFALLAALRRHVRELGASSESKKKRDCDYAELCGIMRNYARKLCGIMHYYAFSGRIAAARVGASLVGLAVRQACSGADEASPCSISRLLQR